MPQTVGLKRFVITHVGASALACGVLVSGALGVAGLGATGNLPWMANNNAQRTAPLSVEHPAVQASDAAYTITTDLAFESVTRASVARYFTPDKTYVIEQALMAEQAGHIAGAGPTSWTLGSDLTPRQQSLASPGTGAA